MNAPSRVVLIIAIACVAGAASAREWGGMHVPLDESDLELLSDAADRLDAAGDAAAPVTWENPKNDTRGSIEVGRRFEHGGAPCVQYRLRIEVTGFEPFVTSPVMCQAGGDWQIVNKRS